MVAAAVLGGICSGVFAVLSHWGEEGIRSLDDWTKKKTLRSVVIALHNEEDLTAYVLQKFEIFKVNFER